VAVHIYTQTIYRTTQITNEQHKYKLIWKSAGCAPSLWVLPWHLPYNCGKSMKKTSVRVRKTSVRLRKTSVTIQFTYYQKHPHITKPSQAHTLQKPSQTHTLQNPHKHTHYKTLTNTHITKPSQTHTLQNPHVGKWKCRSSYFWPRHCLKDFLDWRPRLKIWEGSQFSIE
jgi:hypothetical protein